jgi:hypothetical protein
VINIITDLSFAAGLLAVLLAALEVGYRAGRRALSESAASSQVGTIQGALLGLLGLLLAFSFSAAGTRFLERQDLIVTEANTIGTAYLRAELLDEPRRTELRTALAEYTAHRVFWSAHVRSGIPESVSADGDRFRDRIWRAACDGAAAKPAVILAVLNPVNDLIDLHSLRIAAAHKHLPVPVTGLLIICSLLSVGVISFGCGSSGRRRASLTMPLTFLIAASLWITIDLDHPRAGLLQLSDEPLASLKFDPPPK